MIDWDVLIRADNETENTKNTPKSRARPTGLGGGFEKVGRPESSNDNGFKDSALLALPALLKNEEVGLEQENNSPVEGVASDNYCATETYPVNPIAMCLLLTCCHKAIFNREETIEAIINLQTIPQPEQIRSWAILCQKHGIDPYRIIYPFTNSPNKGTSCQGCKHIEMEKIPTSKRSVYRFVCSKQHQILEAYYIHERVLIAPESCTDYLPTA
ncbi:hypothetical protein W03_19690 [Nitrosomonas sp. PY1]|nr:hypothetical protein W03_19690 [Nitrosomonas sp. PY1]